MDFHVRHIFLEKTEGTNDHPLLCLPAGREMSLFVIFSPVLSVQDSYRLKKRFRNRG